LPEAALPRRLAASLTAAATRHLSAKRSAKALEIWNRVLAFDPHNPVVAAALRRMEGRARLKMAALVVCATVYAYLAVLVNLVETLENMRYRLEVETLIWLAYSPFRFKFLIEAIVSPPLVAADVLGFYVLTRSVRPTLLAGLADLTGRCCRSLYRPPDRILRAACRSRCSRSARRLRPLTGADRSLVVARRGPRGYFVESSAAAARRHDGRRAQLRPHAGRVRCRADDRRNLRVRRARCPSPSTIRCRRSISRARGRRLPSFCHLLHRVRPWLQRSPWPIRTTL
jgi:hypothetical protein